MTIHALRFLLVLRLAEGYVLPSWHHFPYDGPSSNRPRRTDRLAKGNNADSADSIHPKLSIFESDWKGAGSPRDDVVPEELPSLLMKALTLNDYPDVDAGLSSMWAFAGDTTRHVFQHNETEYIESAHETANDFPTSFYGNAFYGKSWRMITPLNRVGGRDGWIATQVMETISSDGRLRRWQWELRKNRRPPNLNCWFVESIGSSDRKGEFEPE